MCVCVCVCVHLFLYLHVCFVCVCCCVYVCVCVCVCVCVQATGCCVDALIPPGQLVAAPPPAPLSKWSSAFVYVCSKALPMLCGEVCVCVEGGGVVDVFVHML